MQVNSLEFELLEHLFSADNGENLASLDVNDSNAFFSLLISVERAKFLYKNIQKVMIR